MRHDAVTKREGFAHLNQGLPLAEVQVRSAPGRRDLAAGGTSPLKSSIIEVGMRAPLEVQILPALIRQACPNSQRAPVTLDVAASLSV